VRAVILAGGRGTRLAPYTSILPKPLMPIGEDQAILEVVLERLFQAGIEHATLCVGYLSHLIRAVLDNGGARGSFPKLTYVQESKPLGTAGPLRLVPDLDETFLMMNGDVLTKLDYRELIAHHERSGNVLTIVTHRRVVKVDYGVLYVSAASGTDLVEAFEEKPEIPLTVSTGVYVVEPEIMEHVPAVGYFDFPDLVQALLRAGVPVGAYEYDGFWLDLGRPEDYELAVEFWNDAPESSVDTEAEHALVGGVQRESNGPTSSEVDKSSFGSVPINGCKGILDNTTADEGDDLVDPLGDSVLGVKA
jgi:NDP-sugar pyrophosphorylase family protein